MGVVARIGEVSPPAVTGTRRQSRETVCVLAYWHIRGIPFLFMSFYSVDLLSPFYIYHDMITHYLIYHYVFLHNVFKIFFQLFKFSGYLVY